MDVCHSRSASLWICELDFFCVPLIFVNCWLVELLPRQLGHHLTEAVDSALYFGPLFLSINTTTCNSPKLSRKQSSHRDRLFYVYIRPLEIILKPHQLNWKHVFSRNSWIINGLILFSTDGFRASSKIPPTICEARPYLARSPIRCWTNNDGS